MARLGLIACVLAVAGSAAAAQVAPGRVGPTEAETAAYDALPDTRGTGRYGAVKEELASFPGHVIYRPDLNRLERRKLGVLAWGNGGCRDDGASARQHLAEIASHGYLAIAPGRILSGPGAPPEATARPRRQADAATGKLPPVATKPAALKEAIDWALAENRRRGSPFYGRIDPSKVAVAGHSCGGLQALIVAGDPRVKTAIIHNSGVFVDGSNPIEGITVDKSLLAKLHGPILYVLGGPSDVAYPNGMDDFRRIKSVPVVVANLDVGHGGTFREKNGGKVAQVAVDWLEWQLFGDKKAAKRFTGAKCGLCVDPAWTVERKRIG